MPLYEKFFDSLEFTASAQEAIYSVADDSRFPQEDVRLIYRQLENCLRVIPFGEYLRRYIYRESEMTQPFCEIAEEEFRSIIRDSFEETGTPAAFGPTTAKLSALVRNWLTQKTVKRNVVLLLGFGLRMSLTDVNEFLTKVLGEHELNAKSPFEVICGYCYRFGYPYAEYERIMQLYKELPPGAGNVLGEKTGNVRGRLMQVCDEDSLMNYLSRLKTSGNQSCSSVTTGEYFNSLYKDICCLIAGMYNQSEEERVQTQLQRCREKMENNDRLYDFEKQKQLQRIRASQCVWSPEDVTPSDLERFFNAEIPKDRHGNMIPSRYSSLHELFMGRRFSRQRISSLMAKNAEIERFDLITMNFFLFAYKLDEIPKAVQRYSAFIESTNRILTECGMGEMYPANPYECFLMMCILSDDPIGAYSEVRCLSYTELEE